MDEIDIWRTAGTLIGLYGEEGVLIAARRADALLAQGDLDGHTAWKRVLAAVKELSRTGRAGGEPVN